jgi:DNA repair photolyase
LQVHLPDRAERVMARVREMRGGRDYDADFATRMKGDGVWAQLIRQRVETAAARHGLLRHTPEMDCRAFVRPAPPAAGVVSPDSAQASLF